MSDFTALRGITHTLRDLLRQHITESGEPGLEDVPIDLRTPAEIRAADDHAVSLWLYRVVRNGYTLNHPPERLAPDRVRRWQLPVDLYYLVTPITNQPDDEQLILGKVLEVFNDHQTLRGAVLQDHLDDTTKEFRLTLEPLALEELTRVWDALKEPYQLSVSYLVQVVTIESGHEPVEVHPVAVKQAGYVQIKEVDG